MRVGRSSSNQSHYRSTVNNSPHWSHLRGEMYLKSILLLFAILSGSTTALPDVGKCTFMEYFCDAMKCQTDFFKTLQKDPNGDCSAKFERLIGCVKRTVHICAGHVLSQSRIESIIRKHFKENVMCLKGGWAVPAIPSVGSPCSSSYTTDAANCLRTFHHKFAADKSDRDLCSENAKAKKCLKDLSRSACTFSSSTQELIDLSYNDYNPFCKNNRDPEVTGNDQCYGVKKLNNPLHSFHSTKSTTPLIFHTSIFSPTFTISQFLTSTISPVTSAAPKVQNGIFQVLLIFPLLMLLLS